MVRMHLEPDITFEAWLLEAAQSILEHLQPYLRPEGREEHLACIRRAVRTALAPYLYINEMCSLTATSHEGEIPSPEFRERAAAAIDAETNPLYLKAEGNFEDLVEALAGAIWANLHECALDIRDHRAYSALSQALHSWLQHSLITYETCGLSLYCLEGEERFLSH